VAVETPQVLASDIFLALASFEPHKGDAVSLGERVDAPDELVGQPSERLYRAGVVMRSLGGVRPLPASGVAALA